MPIKILAKCKSQKEKSKCQTHICKICFSDIYPRSIPCFVHDDFVVCEQCFSLFKPHFNYFNVVGKKALSIYNYDEFIKSKIYQLKGCGDIELAYIFLDRYKHIFHLLYLGYLIVPAPSFIDSDEERGFNHVVEIFRCLKLPIHQVLYKTKDIKQSSQSFEERKNIKDIIEIKDSGTLYKKRVLLVDDIFTTGSTIKACINLLMKCQVKTIKVLVIAKVKEKKMKSQCAHVDA